MDQELIDELRNNIEAMMLQFRESVKAGHKIADRDTDTVIPSMQSHSEVIQTYLLFAILDKLEDIESRLNSLYNEVWVRTPGNSM